jgi:hypothetical protein
LISYSFSYVWSFSHCLRMSRKFRSCIYCIAQPVRNEKSVIAIPELHLSHLFWGWLNWIAIYTRYPLNVMPPPVISWFSFTHLTIDISSINRKNYL